MPIFLKVTSNGHSYLNWLHNARASQQPLLVPFQAVRAAFSQGKQVAPTSGFHANTHIQIALRDNQCVVGWFLPAGAELLNEQQFRQASIRLSTLEARYKKPRVSATKRPDT